jgi:hypothetical protein
MGPQIIVTDDNEVEIVIDHDHHPASEESSDWYRDLEQPDNGEIDHLENA